MFVSRLHRAIWPRLRSFGFWGLADQAALAGSGFLITVAVARTGGPEQLGLFALIQGGVLLFSGLVKSAFGDPLVIQATNRREEDLRCVTPLLLLHLAMGLILVACAIVFRNLSHQSLRSGSTLLLALLLPVAGFYEVARSFRLAGMNERYLFFGDVLVATVRIGSLLLFLFGLEGAALGLWALVLGGFASIVTLKPYLALRINLSALSRLWHLGRWFVTDGLLFGIGQYGIWFIAVPAAGVAVAGEVRGALQLFGPVQLVQVGLTTILLARLTPTQGRFHGDARSLATAQLAISVIWGAVMIGLGPSIASLIFGKDFDFSRFEILMVSVSVIAGAVYGLVTLALRAKSKGRRLVLARGVAVLVTLCGIALVGQSFTGIATSILIGHMAGIIFASDLTHLVPSARGPNNFGENSPDN